MKLRGKQINRLIKIILPVIFINYFACISFFTHTHIVNGITIVHSHPYAPDNDGYPHHEHSGAEIQLISQLSAFHAPSTVVTVIDIIRPIERGEILISNFSSPAFRQEHHYFSFLRPPPVL
ncbi:hypothetical protein [Dysgonomonas sp. 25]|uniref:hypothetical protein n=1 Tax=Dysgonomonas sp. 25 TaxID=2302933 RepID=UPI0013D2B931|nr:hypothetical protein [Dysgonomonas sp. 25]NDV70275.1 hypothetical protein [Dysgonomonas sp. 25]